MRTRPVIGLSSDLKTISERHFHCVGDKYVHAVLDAVGATPILLPAFEDEAHQEEVLTLVDGIVLTGSVANIHPQHYGGGDPYHGSPLDPQRDAANLGLIPDALEIGVPLFGICRGFQEINVALGGSLHQQVHELPHFDAHHEDSTKGVEEQYGPAHPVHLTEGGLLASLADSSEQMVNSLHGQGVDRLADGLAVEAKAGDGLVEAFQVTGARNFALAVQWHPEWNPKTNPFYTAIWREFGDACRRRAAQRKHG